MIDLTPERRAELRELAKRARPFVRHGGTSPAAVYVPAADLLTLLDAADERDRLIEVESRLSVLLWRLTNGRLSKTSYPVEFMEQEIEECLAKYHESDLRDERDRLEVVVERVRALHRSVGIYDECDCSDLAKTEYLLDIYEVGLTCNKLYDICDECCRDNEYQTEECADYHRHGLPDETHLCPTIRALDGTDEKEES